LNIIKRQQSVRQKGGSAVIRNIIGLSGGNCDFKGMKALNLFYG
jgi:hypothetical protein